MNEIIRVNRGIKKYAVVDEEDNIIAELIIDTNDTSLLDRFIELYDNVRDIKNNCDKKFEKLGLNEKENIDTKDAKAILGVNKEAVNNIIDEIEKLFGKGLFKTMFEDNYELNPGFVPDIALIEDFFKQIMPIITSIFQNKSKYSVGKKGKM